MEWLKWDVSDMCVYIYKLYTVYIYINVWKHVLYISICMLCIQLYVYILEPGCFFFVGWGWRDSGFFRLRSFLWGGTISICEGTLISDPSPKDPEIHPRIHSLVIVIKTWWTSEWIKGYLGCWPKWLLTNTAWNICSLYTSFLFGQGKIHRRLQLGPHYTPIFSICSHQGL